MYLDESKERFFYISFGNLSAFLGLFFNENSNWQLNAGGKLAANLIEIGYDGTYLDVSVPIVGIGGGIALISWKPSITLDPPFHFGIDLSIDPIRLAKDIIDALIP